MSTQYEPPYNEEEMRKHGYSEEVIERLKKDPVHGWRMKTGIELIHREPTKTELMRIWQNWQLMTDEMKQKSDAKCKELFGYTNKDLYDYLLPQYKTDRPGKDEVKYPPRESKEELISVFSPEIMARIRKDNNLLDNRDKDAKWTVDSFKSISDLKAFYKIVEYGFVIDKRDIRPDKDEDECWRSGTYKSLILHKKGVCYDTTIMSDHFLTQWRIPHRVVFFWDGGHKCNDHPTHLTCIYQENGEWKWLEGSWGSFKNNNWHAKTDKELISWIAKACANSWRRAAYAGTIEKLPVDGTCMIEFWNIMVAQSEQHFVVKVNPDISKESFMNEYSTITFPKEEIPTISKQDRIITTRVSSDYNKFHEGDIVQTPWNKLYKVTNRLEITNIKDHPYYNELTKDQIAFLSKYDKIAVLTLVLQKDSNEEMIHKWVPDDIFIHKATDITDEQWKLITESVNLAARASKDETWTEEEVKKKVLGSKLDVYFFLQKQYKASETERSFAETYHPVGVLQFNPQNLFITNFAIFKEAQGQGVGFVALKKFMVSMQTKYQDKNIYINVAENNTAAKNLYIKVGFVEESTSNGACRMRYNKRYRETTESNEAINAAVSKNIKNNLVYHSGPEKYDKLLGSKTGSWSGEQGNVFVTPCKGIAACFLINKKDILAGIEKQLGKRVVNCNFGYDIWNKPISELYSIPNEIGVEMNIRGFKPFKGQSTGYLYTIDFSKYKDKCHMFNKNTNSDVEFVIEGDVDYMKCEPVTVNWVCKSSEEEIKRKGEGSVEELNDMESLSDVTWSEEDLTAAAEALSKGITNYLNIGDHQEIKLAYPKWEKDASFKVTEFFQNAKVEKSTVLQQILSRIKLPSEKLTDELSTVEVNQYDRSQLGAIARSIYEFYIKYMVRCNVFIQKLAQTYFEAHSNEDWAHDVRIKQTLEQYDKNLLSIEQIVAYSPFIVKQYAPVELKMSFDLFVDNYVQTQLASLEAKRRESMYSYPDFWDPTNMPTWALVFYMAELAATHHTDELSKSALISFSVNEEQEELASTIYGEIRSFYLDKVHVNPDGTEYSTEGFRKEMIPADIRKKFGKYLYHGTHRDLDINQLAVHFCKNRANRDIKAPVVYMERTLGLASLHCAQFMKGHASKKPDYREHFVEFDKAKDSNTVFKHVEIVHNDPDLKEASGENDGFIYCTKTEDCVDKLYFSTPKDKNDYLFVSYSPLPVDKKIKIHITWHRKYDENFAKEVKENKYAGIESLEYIPDVTDEVSTEDYQLVMDAGKYYIIRSFPVYPFFHRLKKHYNSTKLENLLQIIRSIGITTWFTNTRTIKVHKFFIPELIYLLEKFKMVPFIVDHLRKDTWIGEKPRTHTDCDINRVYRNLNCNLYPHQDKFIREYANLKDSHKLRGYLLSFSQGLGKTITSVALMEALNKDRVVVICPKNTMVETWKSHFQKFYKAEQSIYVSGVDKEFKGQRFCIFNYDAIDKMNSMSGVKTVNMGVIVDESHNFLRIQSGRTRKLIDLAKASDKTDILLMSGTPIKACGVEMIPLLYILDPMFDEEAATIFKNTFGYNVKIATDVLNARLHGVMARVTKDVLDLPPKNRSTIKIKLPNGDKYTIQEVRKGMELYIKERLKYHREHMEEYRKEFLECMEFLEKSKIANDPDFKRYKQIIKKLIHNHGQFEHGDPDIAWANNYEKTVVEKQFTSELLHKFRHCKAAIKYLHLKIRGEVLGQFLGKLRIEMTSAMLKAADIKKLIEEAQKKTIIFTSFVDTIETCEAYVKSLGYKPIVIYGKNSSEIAPLAKLFQTDPSYNPLIASLQTLSTGATLTAANRVIFLNKPWRSVDYEQASDRVHRIGQDCPVDIISLVLDTGDRGNLSTRMEDIMNDSAMAFDAIVEEHTKKKSNEGFTPAIDLSQIKFVSDEGMCLLTDTHEQRVLNKMAKPHYRERGANSWEHVQHDIANGIMLTKAVKHRDLTLQEYATILYHDCGCKSIYPEKNGHGLKGVEIAKPDLKKCGFFSEKEIEDICVAILEHDETTNPKNLHSSELSDLLASADTNPPDIPWILNKSYVWGLRHGCTDHDKNMENVVKYMSKIYGSDGEMIYPKLYREYYKDEIKKMNKFFDKLTVEECAKIVDKYREEHELKHNELTLPEPNTDQKITISTEGMVLLKDTKEQRELNRLAKSFYIAKGQNSWEHIQQDMFNGISMLKKLKHRDITLQEYATILFHDCAYKTHPDGEKHGIYGAEIAKPVLKNSSFFSDEEIEEICQAIIEHDFSSNPEQKFSSELSDFLISADSNPINLAWIMNKCYSWGIRHGKTHEEAVQHVVEFEPSIYGSKGKFVYPKMYKAYYGDKIKEMQKFFDHVTYEQADKIITDYRKRHHLSSTDTRLPDPSLESLELSTEGMPASYANAQFANNQNKRRIWDVCKKYYDLVGSHGVNHIQEVLATAYVLKGKKDLTDVEYAAIVCHDIGHKQETPETHHNLISVKLAKEELPKLNIFTEEQLEAIYKAVLQHSHSWRKSQNIKIGTLEGLSALVAYADRGFPQTSYYEICLRPTLWILEGHDKTDQPEKWERLHHYKTVDDISIGVLETLEKYKNKRHDENEDSIYTRAFAKERAIQNKLRSEISLDVIKPVVIKIMKDYKYAKAVGAEMYAAESLEVSTEATSSEMKIKRKKIQDYILKAMKLLDPNTDINTSYWKKKFDTMSDKDFDNFMHNVREHKENVHMYVPPFKVTLRSKDMVNAAHALGVKLMHRLWMRDQHTGIKYLTPEEYLVVQLPVRRQQQFLDEKLSVPDNDKTIDGLSGQVSGDSKCCSLTSPQIQIFHARNLNASLFELANVRGGNIHNYAEFKRSLEETGEVSLNQLDPMNRTRVAVVGQVWLTAMHLDINLVDI